MWHEGSIKIGKDIFHYWVKVAGEASEIFGLNGGRIIKLSLKRDGKWVSNYDRGWMSALRTKTRRWRWQF